MFSTWYVNASHPPTSQIRAGKLPGTYLILPAVLNTQLNPFYHVYAVPIRLSPPSINT